MSAASPDRTTSSNAAAFSPARDDVFARIAGRYDRLCDFFSLFAHRLWKARMAARIAATPGDVVLDAASGTGDIPLRVLRKLGKRSAAGWSKTLWVTDLCPQMLDMAREKLPIDGNVKFAVFDVHNLTEVAAGSVDIFSISFGMKICDRRRVMAEAFRVLKPGGTFFCLEAARIPVPALHALYLKYMDWCLPLIARLAVRDHSAYDYLLRGVHEFPDQATFANEMAAHGFRDVAFENLTFGIVALHSGRKPL